MQPLASIAVFVATVFLGFLLIGPLVGFIIAVPFYSGDFLTLVDDLSKATTSEEIRVPFLIMQGCATGVGLIAIPLLAYRFIVKMKPSQLVANTSAITVMLTAFVVILFMFPNSVIIDWNANLSFTGGFWDWARDKEDLGERFTKFITTFGSVGDFLIGFFIIAVLPALGEEFTFRGWLQPALQKISGNPHIAIWVSAFLFSALHMQFFGFVPRMLLGAVFGYLMYWSGNLWIPIVAHLVNNGFAVVMIYMHQTGAVQFDAESTEALPLQFVIPGTVIFVGVIFFLKKQIQARGQAA